MPSLRGTGPKLVPPRSRRTLATIGPSQSSPMPGRSTWRDPLPVNDYERKIGLMLAVEAAFVSEPFTAPNLQARRSSRSGWCL